MEKGLFRVFIERLGVKTLNEIFQERIAKAGDDVAPKSKIKLADKILNHNENDKEFLNSIIFEYFDRYHQHIFLFEAEKRINIGQFSNKIKKIEENLKNSDLFLAKHISNDKSFEILFYVPFKVSYHIQINNTEERHFKILHTPSKVRIFPNGIVFSIMVFTKNEWAKLLPENIIDSISHFQDEKIVFSIQSILFGDGGDTHLKVLDFTSKSKKLINMSEIDLFLATRIDRCESRDKSILDSDKKKRMTLKNSVPLKIDEIRKSPIITNLEIILLHSVFDLPEGTILILYPFSGCIRVPKHIEMGNLNEIQDFFYS